MNERDAGKFDQALDTLLALYDRKPSEAVTALWWKAFSDWRLDQVLAAFEAYIQDPEQGKYPPNPASIRGMMQLDRDATANLAFDQVWQAIEQVGPYQSVEFDDPATMRAIVELGGWQHICCTWRIEQRPFLAKDFVVRHKAYQQVGAGSVPALLPGLNTDGEIKRIGGERAPVPPVRALKDLTDG